MKNLSRIIMVAALLGGTLLLGSCTKSEFGQAGKLIQFGARADGASTKTAYAGKDNDASGIEPIWWSEGDQVTIVSNKAIVTNTTDKNYSDYTFSAYVNDNKSRAKVVNSGSNGLAWLDEDPDEGYDFYAVYPNTLTIGHETGNLGSVLGEIFTPQEVEAHEYDATKTGEGSAADWYPVKNGKYTVFEPDMQYAYMTAAKHVNSSTETVDLIFYPAFTAFEFTFESADPEVDIDLTEFRMESTSTALAGKFSGDAGDRAFDAMPTASKILKLSNPDALGTIKNGEPKSFTLFAMPQDLTDITIKFTDNEGTRVLPLNYSSTYTGTDVQGNSLAGKPLTFQAGHKYRIKGLKLPGNKYQFFLTINGIVQKWDEVELETLFSDQIQCSALTFNKSAQEMTTKYYNSPTTTTGSGHTSKNNNYKLGAPVGDGRWQVRTLNTEGMDEGEPEHDYFEVSFTPTAPLGGYWRLVPHNEQYWTIQVVGKPGQIDEEITDLPSEGRIMNQKVTLRITPKMTLINETPLSTEIGLYFDCYFSTNIDFDPVLDANTEFQDIHGAGTYSYWLLTVDRQN